jgi:hypothetical protein
MGAGKGISVQRERVVVDKVFIERATDDLRRYLLAAQVRWLDLSTYPRKGARLEAQECLECFYGSHVTTASMSSRPCADCPTVTVSGCGICAILCKLCAKKRKVCRICGAKMGTKPRVPRG